ncbi:dihydroorotase [Alienimonas californiensis]|uniref:Dihydroorotase n=1 Tax=Alienimonas californiensis TaxID=2527989 RepID=A0A517PBU7_9PLAN|nr:dihydroorotase [Alienimonas californiensis]QDT16831.1 Dihydroorotase [Alienimonas californiensis]
MAHRTLLRGGDAVVPDGSGFAVRRVDVLLDGGTLRIDPPATVQADEIVDCSGKLIFPGVIDDQVHLRDPGLTHKEDLRTGTAAAAAGGVTTVLEMPNTKPATTTRALWEAKNKIAEEKALVNWGFYMGATPDNLEELQAANPDVTCGIKIFIGSSTGNLLVDAQEALERIFAETTLPLCAHCEDETTVRRNTEAVRQRLGEPPWPIRVHSDIRNEEAAVVSVRRAIDLATRHDHRFHVLHVSTAGELREIAQAGPQITAEVCPHHLLFDTGDYERLGSWVQMNPAIKSVTDRAAMWQALADGETIQVVATDHAPHTREEKEADYPASPSGLPALENSLSLLLTHGPAHGVTVERLAAAMCDAPARVWGLIGKGRLADGYDADVCVVDPHATFTVRHEDQLTKSHWSPWHGEELTGRVLRTFVAGQTVYEDGAVRRKVAGHATAVRCDHARGGYHATPDGIGLA